MNLPAQPITQAKPRPALRLIKTTDLSRDDWLTVRKNGIGSSDAAAAVGLNPYKSQLELWMEKTGRDGALPKADPHDEESPMYWGNILEPIVAAHYARRTNLRVRKINAVLQHPDPDKSWMLANIDREITGSPDVQILECKTAGITGARLWKEGVPEYVQLQVHHQLAVTGKRAADVAVLIGGQHLAIYRIERDETMIERLVELERQFWRHVERDDPPPADGSESADQALRYLYPRDDGSILDFKAERNLSACFADLVSIRQAIAEHQKLESQLRQRIEQAMGDASRAEFETGCVTWKRSKDSLAIDLPRLLIDHPELQTQYSLIKPGSRRFLIV